MLPISGADWSTLVKERCRNDASELLPVVDMVVMICRAGKTTKESADRAAELLERFRAPVVGGVLVAAANAPTRQYYYYYAATPKPMPEAEPTNPLADLRAGRKGKREAGVAASSRAGATTDEAGGGDVGHAIAALEYAAAAGIRITNNSWGSLYYSRALYDAIAAIDGQGLPRLGGDPLQLSAAARCRGRSRCWRRAR